MAIALVANTGAQSADSNSVTTAGINTTGATLLVAVVSYFPGSVSLSDSVGGLGNTWVQAVDSGGTPGVSAIWYVKNPTHVGSGHTFTQNVSGSFPSIDVLAFSGTDTSANVDQINSVGNGAPPQATGSVTPSADNEVVVSGFAINTTGSDSIDSGFTITDQQPSIAGLCVGGAAAYLIQTTATAVNPTWDGTHGFGCGVTIATFKAAASGTGLGLSFLSIGR
jgi:hypothetical protein